jgi:DNA-binding response OmpR family regulator
MLNAKKCMFIECLLSRPGQVAPKEVLTQSLGAHGEAWGEPRLAQTAFRLRRKIEALGPDWQPLRIVHRVAYAFDVVPVDQATGDRTTP